MQGKPWYVESPKQRRRRRRRQWKQRRRARNAFVVLVLISLALAVGYLVGVPETASSLRQDVDKAITSMRDSLEATPMPTPTPLLEGTPMPFNASTIEQMVFILTNEERRKAGIPLLKLDPGISDVARKHSADMVVRGFNHDLGGLGPHERAYAAGFPCGFAENIYMHHRKSSNEAMARALVDGWMESPGHRKNILRPNALEIGVGIVVTRNDVYATQNFDIC